MPLRSIRLILGLMFLTLCPLRSVGAAAATYTVSYAFDAVDELNDWGTQTCEYTTYCRFKSEKLKLSIELAFWDPNHKKVTIRVSGERGRWGCCFFPDGVDKIERDAKESLIRLHVYVGHQRIRNEFIQNEPLGTLYLHFIEIQ
jgi:hypothetical protein